ncbi:neprilysin-1-like [Haliotis rufescens]|uniref:neprilysin-1-like n=1 Tax=Haliotis rufescens TaxID=6454 RepID=UPI001EB06646|nr:neprilysin-1-like [Haliotis rufescens]XP_046376735.1 neprilysin-1-like [Haliotis rufescens]
MAMADGSKAGSLASVTGSKNVLYAEDITFDKGSWWSRRTSLEKKMAALILVCLLTAVIFLVVVIVLASERNNAAPKIENGMTMPSPAPKPAVCLTPDCVATSGRLLGRMNLNADPCDNFYEFACGSWMEKNIIAEDKSANDIFRNLGDSLLIKLQRLLEAPPVEGESTSVKEAKKMYESCMDLDTIDKRGKKPLIDSLPEFGGWPVLSPAWNESAFNLEETLVKLSNYNNVPIIYLAVVTDPANTTVRKLYYDQPSLGLPGREYYLKERNSSTLKAYEDYIIRTAVALGANQVDASDQIRDLVDFEIEIANITVPLFDRLDQSKQYNPMSIAEMAQNYSQFDWLKHVRDIMAEEGVDINITAEEVVINWSPPYFEKLFPILEKTPKRVLANYAIWMLIKQRVKLLDSSFRDSITTFNQALSGTSAQPPRWKVCSTYVNSAMSLSVGRLYVDAHFKEAAKSDMLNIISYLRSSFNALLEEAVWLDDTTRTVAREKAEVMDEKIGYPEALKNNSYIDDQYKHHIFNTSLYFENVQIELQQASRKHLRSLRLKVDRSEWLVQPAVINAFYNPTWNEIVFPAGILQEPFYSESQPGSINFGGVGSVIGHEITHGFDNYGRQRDKDGNLRQWWDQIVIDRFQNATKCFVNQTSSYVSPEAGLNVNGLLTMGEDIADSGGVKQSYKAYRKWVADRGAEEAPLPGMTLNHNQLFFLAWSQVWCTKIRKERAERNIYSDYHSPNRLRAVSPLQNLPEFAEVYNCKPGSFMNPRTKCTVW